MNDNTGLGEGTNLAEIVREYCLEEGTYNKKKLWEGLDFVVLAQSRHQEIFEE